jgi:hypothetical protein
MIAYLILKSLESCPTTHDECIVGGKNSDNVHALCFELVILLQERREVPRVTSRLRRNISVFAYFASGDHGDKKENRIRTVKAPGTETRTTFLSLQSSVERVVAEIRVDLLDLTLKEDDKRTDTASRL